MIILSTSTSARFLPTVFLIELHYIHIYIICNVYGIFLYHYTLKKMSPLSRDVADLVGPWQLLRPPGPVKWHGFPLDIQSYLLTWFQRFLFVLVAPYLGDEVEKKRI